MGDRISKYKIYLETFYTEVTNTYAVSNIDLRLKRFDRCVKAIVLNEQLSKLRYNIENGIPDMDECGIDYEEWISDKKWDGLIKLQNSAEKLISSEEFVDIISTYSQSYAEYNKERIESYNKDRIKSMSWSKHSAMSDDQRNSLTQPVDFFQNQFDSSSLLSAFRTLISENNASNEILDIVFKVQIDEIRRILYDIFELIVDLDYKNIEDDQYVELYNRFSRKYDAFTFKGKLIREYRVIKGKYPDEIRLEHFKNINGQLINEIFKAGYLSNGIEYEVVDNEEERQFKDELTTTRSNLALDIEDENTLKFYHKFRCLFNFENGKYIPDYAKLGRAIHKMRANLVDAEIGELIWKIKLINLVSEEIDKYFPQKEKQVNALNDIDQTKSEEIKHDILNYVSVLSDKYDGTNNQHETFWNKLLKLGDDVEYTTGRNKTILFFEKNMDKGMSFNKGLIHSIIGQMVKSKKYLCDMGEAAMLLGDDPITRTIEHDMRKSIEGLGLEPVTSQKLTILLQQ